MKGERHVSGAVAVLKRTPFGTLSPTKVGTIFTVWACSLNHRVEELVHTHSGSGFPLASQVTAKFSSGWKATMGLAAWDVMVGGCSTGDHTQEQTMSQWGRHRLDARLEWGPWWSESTQQHAMPSFPKKCCTLYLKKAPYLKALLNRSINPQPN